MFQSLKNRGKSSKELTDELLSAYLDGELPGGDRAALEVRLQHEQALVTRLEGLRQIRTALADLPQVEVPRNFILAPSMVAHPKPAAAPRQRRTWPVFGWATAVATLLLLVVFAGDLFFYTPPTRPEPADAIAQQPQPLGKTAIEDGVERQAAAIETAAGVGEAPAAAKAEEVVVEAEVPVEATAPAETVGQAPVATDVMEQEGLPESETLAVEMVEVGGEPAPPATESGGEAPPEEERTTRDIETPSFEELPALSVAVTSTVESDEAVVTAPSPTQDVIPEAADAAQAAAAPVEEAEEESAMVTQALREGVVDSTPQAVASAPEELPPAVTGAEQDADNATRWLRLAEIGLGLAILALATVTLILRRREA